MHLSSLIQICYGNILRCLFDSYFPKMVNRWILNGEYVELCAAIFWTKGTKDKTVRKTITKSAWDRERNKGHSETGETYKWDIEDRRRQLANSPVSSHHGLHIITRLTQPLNMLFTETLLIECHSSNITGFLVEKRFYFPFCSLICMYLWEHLTICQSKHNHNHII